MNLSFDCNNVEKRTINKMTYSYYFHSHIISISISDFMVAVTTMDLFQSFNNPLVMEGYFPNFSFMAV